MDDSEDSVAFHHSDFSFDEIRAICEHIPLPPIISVASIDDAGLESNSITRTSEASSRSESFRCEPGNCGDDFDAASMYMQHWDNFFARHKKGTFFKARRYIVKEFETYLSGADVVLEVGSGYGCTMLPIIKYFPAIRYIATDYSPHAIDILRSTDVVDRSRVYAEVVDIIKATFDVKANLPGLPPPQCCLAIFVLSAINTEFHATAVSNIRDSLAPGGYLLFRDYGMFDMTMFRHKIRLEEHLFQRSDKTLSYYFDLVYVDRLFSEVCGLMKVELRYDCVRCSNKRTGQIMNRIFVHAVYKKV